MCCPDAYIAIAETWYQDWSISKFIVESYGGKFVGILQPVSYVGTPYKEHLNGDPMISDEQLAAQYATIYTNFKKILKNNQFAYLDLSNSLNKEDTQDIPYYFDFCHLSPGGNILIAEKIAKYISSKSE